MCNVVVAGVGGQGVLSTARLLGRAATEADLEARVGQIYGLSQRGGSVEATIRIGPATTAFIPWTEADVVVGLEPLEAERAIPRMSTATTVLVNSTPIVPTSLTLDRTTYPDLFSIVGRIATVAGIVHDIDANTLALQAGHARLLNAVMLGALDGLELLPIPTNVLASTVENLGSGPDAASRSKAFCLGQDFGVGAFAGTSDVRG